jgi:Mg-chelatase subunit ChlD
VVVVFSTEQEVKEFSKAEQSEGSLQMQLVEDKLMHSILQHDQETIDDGKIIEEAVNQNISAFTPNMLFDKLVKSFSLAKQLYGERLLRLLTGYEPDYLEKNLGIPEFQKELKKQIEANLDRLKNKDLIGARGEITDKGIELASLILYIEELDNIIPKGMIGEKINKKTSHYGEKADYRTFKKGDRYRDIAVRKSIRTAIKRKHKTIKAEDLKTATRQSKGAVNVIYGLDSSASMKGDKIATCKKAGVALAYKAINAKDKVGLIVFGTEVKDFVEPTDDFGFLLNKITRVKASKQTDFVEMIKKSTELFPGGDATNHLVILTDALPTVGKKPEEETLKAISAARAAGITVSVIGIKLDEKGEKLAKQIADLGEGRFYIVRDLKRLDKLVLEDYYSVR